MILCYRAHLVSFACFVLFVIRNFTQLNHRSFVNRRQTRSGRLAGNVIYWLRGHKCKLTRY
jgi:hypothetical protein